MPTTFTSTQDMSTLRKSCRFCRSRKVRCSGHSICNACKERNIDCSYEKEGIRGRRKVEKVKQTARTLSERLLDASPSSGSVNSAGLDALSALDESQPAVSCTKSVPSLEPPAVADILQMAGYEHSSLPKSIANELQQIFYRKYVKKDHPGCRSFKLDTVIDQRKSGPSELDTVIDQMKSSSSTTEQDRQSDTFRPMEYEDLISFMPQDIVELLVLRFGALGCDRIGANGIRYLRQSLERDSVTTMFDRPVEFSTTLSDYRQHRTQQMLEIWFSRHPLSFIVSKTLLLREIRDGKYEEVLLAVMLADVECAQQDGQARGKGEAMFTWASAQLCRRSRDSENISIAQALMLLGWRQLCTSKPHRAMCYFEWVATVAPALQEPELGLHRINGVDIAHVFVELKRNMCWFAYCVTLWTLMQTDSATRDILPSTTLISFPPVTEPKSATLQLDVVSDNLSTLSSQRLAFRQLWPLCHLSSTVAHIYALYPQRRDADDLSLSSCWQKRTVYQLRNAFTVENDLPPLCARIRSVLLDTLEPVKLHLEDRTSQAMVNLAYQTMAVHFLFPRLEDSSAPVSLTNAIIDSFCESAESILQVSRALEQLPDEGRVAFMPVRPCSDASTCALAFATCARAVDSLRKLLEAASQTGNRQFEGRRADLLRVATELHAYSKQSRIVHSAHLGLIKKQLKMTIRSLDAPASSLGDPNRSEGAMFSRGFVAKDQRDLRPRTNPDLSRPPEVTPDTDEVTAWLADFDETGLHCLSHAFVAENPGQLGQRWWGDELHMKELGERESGNDGDVSTTLPKLPMPGDARTSGLRWEQPSGVGSPLIDPPRCWHMSSVWDVDSEWTVDKL